jgi:hypothetical protein
MSELLICLVKRSSMKGARSKPDWACTVGSGFTARSTLNSNLIEDAQAGSSGSYAATASANNGWTMQMVALKPAP